MSFLCVEMERSGVNARRLEQGTSRVFISGAIWSANESP